ncbi:hypothetical protein EYF80_011806 [Liparis tanakae]|uniref:Uncharacterized protein n=1 Tax=Liparis tanakae TaxID=230148 RepID=A0A4Z2ILH6_9TELE|nr:hypothetical protein EYF80_011806 [Liparis tanakae]
MERRILGKCWIKPFLSLQADWRHQIYVPARLLSRRSSRYLTPPHATSRHLTPPHATSRYLSPPHATSRHLTPPLANTRHLTLPLANTRHLTLPLANTRHLTLPHANNATSLFCLHSLPVPPCHQCPVQ